MEFSKKIRRKDYLFLEREKPIIEPLFVEFSDGIDIKIQTSVDFKNLIDAPPEKSIFSEPDLKISYLRKPIKTNYLLREQNNIALGEKGEGFVIEYEKWRLKNDGKESLADAIEWISKTDDGAGFDILSKNKNRTDRYIEVKTTKLSKDTPIFFSKSEYDVSREKGNQYFLYRVFNFNENPRMFNLNGDFDSFCRKESVQYKGYF